MAPLLALRHATPPKPCGIAPVDLHDALTDTTAMDLRREDLDDAVAAGVIDAGTRDRLVVWMARRTDGAAGPDNESFRLLTGFNDIFVALACILLLVAVLSLMPSSMAGLAVAAAAWGLAGYFTRNRRMALPSIILLLAFVGGMAAFSFLLAGTTLEGALASQRTTSGSPAFAVAGAVAVVAAGVHWARFRVPITLAAGAAGVALAIIAGAVAMAGPQLLLPAMLFSGLGIFVLAMRYDLADRSRITRNTDIAFWLHLLAAPLIIHPIFALTGLSAAGAGIGAAIMVLLVYGALTAVALIIDRRALLVSALAYVLLAVRGLFAVGEVAAGFGLTALILGSFLVMLSAAWGALRRRLLAALPVHWVRQLPGTG